MLNDIIESYLRQVEARDVTEVFLWGLIVCLGLAVINARRGTAPRFTTYAPTFLTSLGILGTFVGIVVGLLDFDAQRIDQSIGGLLEGLKTAFITSLAGMGAGIAFKMLSTTHWLAVPRQETDTAAAGPEDVLVAIREQTVLLSATRDAIAGSEESSLAGQLKLLRTDLNDQTKEISETRKAIAGAEESSLTGQVKLLRADLDDRHRRDREAMDAFADLLWKHLGEFAEMLSRSATEQVIQALKEVIVDFNRNLTEQFGENFKALDASVQKLVEWQAHYREQLRELHTLYSESVKGISQIEAAVTKIAASSASIPETMERLSGIIETSQHQLAELERHLAAFQEMRDRAVEAIPKVQAHVEEMTSEIAAAVEAASEHYRKLLDVSDSYIEAQDERAQEMLAHLAKAGAQVQSDIRAMIKDVASEMSKTVDEASEHFKKLMDNSDRYIKTQDEQSRQMLETLASAGEQLQRDTQAIQKQVVDSVGQMQGRVEAAVDEAVRAQNRATSQAVEGMLEEMRKAVTRTGEGVNSQLTALDAAMQQELNRVMNEMGRALAQITGKFAEDYARLTEAMARVVRQSGAES